MKKFTVFAVEQFTGKIKRACVTATDLRHAFVPAAATAPNHNLVASFPGWLKEDDDFVTPGTFAVPSETLGQQTDALQPTPGDLQIEQAELCSIEDERQKLGNLSTAGFTSDELADLSTAVGNLIQDQNDYCRFEEGTEELIKRLETLQGKIRALSLVPSPAA